LISDQDIEKAIDYLRDNASKAARARAEREYMDEYRKVVKSSIMLEHAGKTIGAQEAIAYSDPRYLTHLKIMKEAIEKDEYHRWMRTAAEAKLEAWRTQSANHRLLDAVK
jgi:hypothetical protein